MHDVNNFEGSVVVQELQLALCPSIFSSIVIELNVPRDNFSLIAIQLTFVILAHGFKTAGSTLYDICAPWTRTF